MWKYKEDVSYEIVDEYYDKKEMISNESIIQRQI